MGEGLAPSRRVGGKADLGQGRVGPGTFGEVGLDGAEEGAGLAFGREGPRALASGVIPVAGLPAR